jgi:hypothetical protein
MVLQAWLNDLEKIFGRLKSLCGEYASIAAQSDRLYIEFSPVHNADRPESFATDFLVEDNGESQKNEIDDASAGGGSSTQDPSKKLGRLSLTRTRILAKDWSKGVVQDFKWALFQKTKVEDLIRRFRKQNKKLRDLVSLAVGVNSRLRTLNAPALARIAEDPNARNLGLSNHAMLRRLAIEPTVEVQQFELEGMMLEEASDMPANPGSALIVADLYRAGAAAHEDQTVLVEYKYASDPNPGVNAGDRSARRPSLATTGDAQVRQLAGLLSAASNSGMRTLAFRGYIPEPLNGRCAFVFDFPPQTQVQRPQSLHDLLTSGSPSDRLSLPMRFQIAQSIAQAIGAFHADGWVHKSFRSESIFFFPLQGQSDRSVDFTRPYVTNFEYSRQESALSLGTWEDKIENNVYRHPDRQGPPSFSFIANHDVYALGVVLLELGTWQPAMAVYNEYCARQPGIRPKPRGIRKILLSMAAKKLPYHMGPAYAQAVDYCLSIGSNAVDGLAMEFRRSVVQKLDIKSLITT